MRFPSKKSLWLHGARTQSWWPADAVDWQTTSFGVTSGSSAGHHRRHAWITAFGGARSRDCHSVQSAEAWAETTQDKGSWVLMKIVLLFHSRAPFNQALSIKKAVSNWSFKFPFLGEKLSVPNGKVIWCGSITFIGVFGGMYLFDCFCLIIKRHKPYTEDKFFFSRISKAIKDFFIRLVNEPWSKTYYHPGTGPDARNARLSKTVYGLASLSRERRNVKSKLS